MQTLRSIGHWKEALLRKLRELFGLPLEFSEGRKSMACNLKSQVKRAFKDPLASVVKQ